MNPIAMMFALIAGVILLPALYTGISNYGDQIRATATALQMAHIQKAAEAYITTNAAAVDANSTASSPAIITVPMLVNTGFLPNGFNSMNPYGQTWQVQVLQPAANQLQALVLGVGGNAITAKQSGMIATTAGDSGGVIGGGSGDFAVPGCSGGEACGAYAGWSVSTAGYQNVAAAHPAALIEYANNQLQSDYLYRVAVPGQPQLNTMQTNLNMGANNINNANEVNAQSETLAGGQPNGQYGALQIGSNYYYGDSSNAAVRTPGSFYIQNQNGSGPAQIAEVSNVWGSGELQGGYINSTGNVNAQNALTVNGGSAWWANNAGDSSQSGNAYVGGQVAAGNQIVSSGPVIAGNGDSEYGFVSYTAGQGGACAQNGAIIGSTIDGKALVCQSGSWQPLGGGTTVSANGSWSVYLPSYGLWTIYGAIWTANENSCYSESLYINGTYVNANPGCDDETVSGVVQEYAGPGWVSMSASGNASNVGPYEIIAWQG